MKQDTKYKETYPGELVASKYIKQPKINKYLKQKLIDVRNGAMITPIVYEIMKELEKEYQRGFISGSETTGEQADEIWQIKLRDQREEINKELAEKIIKIKEAVAKRQGTHKYDSCYNDVLELLI